MKISIIWRRFRFIAGIALLLVMSGAANAQTGVTPAPADDLTALQGARAVARTVALWDKAIAWQEKDVSLSLVLTHVRAALEPDAPEIELRAPDTSQSTFAASKATLGPTLVSLALLANCRVWVFDHVVIAPESALTDDERAFVKRKASGEWTLSSDINGLGYGWSARNEVSRLSVRIVSADLKARLLAKGVIAPVATSPKQTSAWPNADEKAPFELPFGELQPATQQVLQELVNDALKPSDEPLKANQSSVLAPSVVVCFDDLAKNTSQQILYLRGARLDSYYTRWYEPK